jgi:hypothetical protein
MASPLYEYLSDDHDRFDQLLDRAEAKPGMIDQEPYAEFRKAILRHIGIEEKIIMPSIARLQDGRQAALAEQIRLEHGAIAALMVPPPSRSIIATLRSILQVHNVLEEQNGGLYELIDKLIGADADALLDKLKNVPEVPVVPHNERPAALEAARRAVARAGYEFKDMPG